MCIRDRIEPGLKRLKLQQFQAKNGREKF
jgi:hypothetical protein